MHRMAYWEWNATGDAHCPHVIVCVHGLTRQAHDFDVLAHALSTRARVICPDVVGRGASDWLSNPMDYAIPQYVADMLALLQQLHANAPIQRLDWVGTSMGGLIGMCVAALPSLGLPVVVHRLVLNDVGPRLEDIAVQRIGSYVGQAMHFSSVESAAQHLRALSQGFGPHTEVQWLALTQPMLRPDGDGAWILHYDPDIAQPLVRATAQDAAQGQTLLWRVYDTIKAETLLLRGAESDLLSAETAREMAQRGPQARCVTLEGVGHAPTLVHTEQVQIVSRFLFG